VVSGCIMMRVCHLDTCPVGIATQNPELRKKFSGQPEFVVNFFEFIAQEVREYLAMLGFRSVAEAVGRVDRINAQVAVDHWKASGLDIAPLLAVPANPYNSTLHHSVAQDHGLADALDNELIARCAPALEDGHRVEVSLPIRNVNRSVGTMLGSRLTKKWGGAGLADDTITLRFAGSAGQSFGAFVPRGITMMLEGDANDYLAKGLSGGRIVVRPDRRATFAAQDNVIAGNVIGYGATSGEMYLRGVVGERFCVRNSGATAVVEGVGDHGCEYMTGGRVVVLGATGRNFAAGMSGGIAYVLDESGSGTAAGAPGGDFASCVNTELVDIVPLDADDREWLLTTLRRHYELTESAVSARLLALGDPLLNFRKVLPRDYARVLRVIADAKSAGLDDAATSQRIMESVNG
ncbi:MAG: glutamate synthase-related protein, partial [Ilumatobacteraceae bacterium]